MFRRRIAGIASIAAAVLAAASGAATASCLEQVAELAAEHKLATNPPKATPDTAAPDKGPEVTSKKLAQSGGVIQPPPVQDKAVIAPPKSSDRMQTMPDVQTAPKESTQDNAAARATLQSLLVAARAQAERGDERQCFEGVDKARELLQRKQ